MGETVQQGVGHFDLQVEMFAWSGVVEKTLVLLSSVVASKLQDSAKTMYDVYSYSASSSHQHTILLNSVLSTFRQYYNDVARAAKSMVRLGLEPHHGVCILGFNAPEWFIGYMAGIMVSSTQSSS